MNKRAARERALSGEISVGELRKHINAARALDRKSRVNPAFHLSKTCDIYDAALEGRDDNEVPVVLRPDPYSRKGRMKPTKDVLLMTNILRDCA